MLYEVITNEGDPAETAVVVNVPDEDQELK